MNLHCAHLTINFVDFIIPRSSWALSISWSLGVLKAAPLQLWDLRVRSCYDCLYSQHLKVMIFLKICTSARVVFHTLPKLAVWWPSDQFSHPVMSDSLWCHELQLSRPPCPSPTPRVHPNPYPSSQWCHPAISSSVIPFSSCLQSFPSTGSFPMRQLFTSGGQSIGASASTSVLPMNIQDWSL